MNIRYIFRIILFEIFVGCTWGDIGCLDGYKQVVQCIEAVGHAVEFSMILPHFSNCVHKFCATEEHRQCFLQSIAFLQSLSCLGKTSEEHLTCLKGHVDPDEFKLLVCQQQLAWDRKTSGKYCYQIADVLGPCIEQAGTIDNLISCANEGLNTTDLHITARPLNSPNQGEMEVMPVSSKTAQTSENELSKYPMIGIFIPIQCGLILQPRGSLVYPRRSARLWHLSPITAFMEGIVIIYFLFSQLRRQSGERKIYQTAIALLYYKALPRPRDIQRASNTTVPSIYKTIFGNEYDVLWIADPSRHRWRHDVARRHIGSPSWCNQEADEVKADIGSFDASPTSTKKELSLLFFVWVCWLVQIWTIQNAWTFKIISTMHLFGWTSVQALLLVRTFHASTPMSNAEIRNTHLCVLDLLRRHQVSYISIRDFAKISSLLWLVIYTSKLSSNFASNRDQTNTWPELLKASVWSNWPWTIFVFHLAFSLAYVYCWGAKDELEETLDLNLGQLAYAALAAVIPMFIFQQSGRGHSCEDALYAGRIVCSNGWLAFWSGITFLLSLIGYLLGILVNHLQYHGDIFNFILHIIPLFFYLWNWDGTGTAKPEWTDALP